MARVRRPRRSVALLVGLATFGLVGASAASLGGITSRNLGADAAAVTSCDTDGVTLAFTNTYDATLGRYQTTAATVSGIAAGCAGKSLALTLKDASGGSLASGTVPSIVGTSAAVSFTSPGANATLVVGAALVITG
ncbi:MAG TPA: hypothetical protein DEG43_15685 [Acidimicrobiaceae bacterium]|nr:hypothetical protein [Acidimicrobiaceae bacterium]